MNHKLKIIIFILITLLILVVSEIYGVPKINRVLWFLNEVWPFVAGFLVGWLAVKIIKIIIRKEKNVSR